ncbi:MAG: hypothetical protein WC101_01410 [Candidatus Gracilibacteria bacterium]
MAKNHKGSHRRSLSVALSAGATLFALVLAPTSAAYLYQTSVVGQNFGGPGQQMQGNGPQNMTKQFKKEIDKANKLTTALGKLDFSACDKYDTLTARFEELRTTAEDLADSLDTLDDADIAKAKVAAKEAKNAASQAKKDAKKALTACNKPITKAMSALRSANIPVDPQDAMEALMNCKKTGDCSDVDSAIDSLKEDVATFAEERQAELDDMLAQQEEEKANRMEQDENMMNQKQDENNIGTPGMKNQKQYFDTTAGQKMYPDPDHKPTSEQSSNKGGNSGPGGSSDSTTGN